MVGVSDVDSSSAYSTSSSSSSEDEGDRRKNKRSSKNLSGLSCFARDGFCTMALSSGSKKSDSDSESEYEVGDLQNIWLIGCQPSPRVDLVVHWERFRDESESGKARAGVLVGSPASPHRQVFSLGAGPDMRIGRRADG
jgi:hypothetical protein